MTLDVLFWVSGRAAGVGAGARVAPAYVRGAGVAGVALWGAVGRCAGRCGRGRGEGAGAGVAGGTWAYVALTLPGSTCVRVFY